MDCRITTIETHFSSQAPRISYGLPERTAEALIVRAPKACLRKSTMFGVLQNNDNYWEVATKDGLVSFYGTPGSAGSDAAVVASPADPEKIFSWGLTKTTDSFGNTILYEYQVDQGASGLRKWSQWSSTTISNAQVHQSLAATLQC